MIQPKTIVTEPNKALKLVREIVQDICQDMSEVFESELNEGLLYYERSVSAEIFDRAIFNQAVKDLMIKGLSDFVNQWPDREH